MRQSLLFISLTCCLGAAWGQADPCKGLPEGGGIFLITPAKPAAAGPIQVLSSRVIEDSRCPEKAVCVWEGRAVIEFEIQQGTETSKIRMGYQSRQPMRVVSKEGEPIKLQPGTTPFDAFNLGVVHMPPRRAAPISVSSMTLHISPVDPSACSGR